jgi:hypothetical protein
MNTNPQIIFTNLITTNINLTNINTNIFKITLTHKEILWLNPQNIN